jgi:hypothetical protein
MTSWRNPERQKVQETLIIARHWTRLHAPAFVALLDQIALFALKELNKMHQTDAVFDLMERIKLPPHERPLCHALVDLFPQSMLLHTIQKNPDIPILRKVGSFGGIVDHSDFILGTIHIDPTFGQFFRGEFSQIQKAHPALFQQHILVATEQEIQNAFDITYQKNSSQV